MKKSEKSSLEKQLLTQVVTSFPQLLIAAVQQQTKLQKLALGGLENADERIKMLTALEDIKERRLNFVFEKIDKVWEPFKPALENFAQIATLYSSSFLADAKNALEERELHETISIEPNADGFDVDAVTVLRILSKHGRLDKALEGTDSEIVVRGFVTKIDVTDLSESTGLKEFTFLKERGFIK